MSRRPLLLGLAALASPACTILAGVDGLSGGGAIDDGGTADAPHESAASDAPTSDAPMPSDAADRAAPDAADAATADARDAAPPPAFCSTIVPAPKLCEDFDHGPFDAQFSQTVISANATLGADNAAWKSAPTSLLAHIDAAGSGKDYAFLSRLFAGTATARVTLAFDLRVESWSTGSHSAIVGGIFMDDNMPSEHHLTFYLQDTTAGLEESFAGDAGNVYLDHTLATHPLLGAWTRVEVTLDLSARTCSATLDGVQALPPTTIDPTWKAGTPSVYVGITYVADESMPWQFRYDDVVADFQ